MLKNNYGKVAFGPDFPIENVTFELNSVGDMSGNLIERIVAAFNEVGFFILACTPRNLPKENLLALTPFFGRVVPHNRSGKHGVLTVSASKPVPGFIDSSNEAHPPHTDGSFKDNPEKVVALQCVVPAESGGTSLLGCGMLAHDALGRDDLQPLYDRDAVCIKRNEQSSVKPVFKRVGERVEMCFRMDKTAAETRVKPDAQDGFTRLKATLDENLLRFDMAPHQILVLDNTAIVHGREEFSAGAGRLYFRLNFEGNGLLDLNYGF